MPKRDLESSSGGRYHVNRQHPVGSGWLGVFMREYWQRRSCYSSAWPAMGMQFQNSVTESGGLAIARPSFRAFVTGLGYDKTSSTGRSGGLLFFDHR